MATVPKKKKGKVIAVLNMKGGVGKTTISAHVFRHLFQRLQKSVVLIDFDPQFNLTQTIIKEENYEKLKEERKTILSVLEDAPSQSLFKITSQLGPPPSLASVSTGILHLVATPATDLTLVAGDFDLARYSLISDSKVLEPARKRFVEFIAHASEQKDIVCIDCNPSSSFMTLCALEAATHVLVPVRPDRYSILGLRLLDKFIDDAPTITNKPKYIVMLNGIRTNQYDPAVEDTLRGDPDFGPSTMASSLPISKLLEASQSYTGFASDKSHSWRITPRMNLVVNELKTILGY